MAHATYRFIDPRTLAALRDLELVARTVVDGFMYGIHPSRIPGAGIEFSQYRSYQPGDDLRRIDWKLLGRSDRYFVREADTDTSLTLRLVLDASASMGAEDDGLTSFDYARFAAAALAVLAHRQGDAVGLYAVGEGVARVVPPDRRHQQVHRLLHELEQVAPGGVWPSWPVLEGALLGGGGRGLVVFLTDLHERVDEIRQAARTFAALRHETLVLHLIGRREMTLDYPGVVTFEELETGRRLDVDTGAERESYRTSLNRHLDEIRRGFEERGIGYTRLALDQPLDFALRAWLKARGRAGVH